MLHFRIQLVAALALALGACNSSKENAPLAHDHEHDHTAGHVHGEAEAHESANEHGESHGEEIILEPATAELFGVETAEVAPGNFHEVIRVSGQIVDTPNSASYVSSPRSGIVTYAAGIYAGKEVRRGQAVASVSASSVSGGNADEAARLAMQAAKSELDRITPLYKEGLVTVKDYNAAVQAYDQAKAAYSPKAASGVATSPAEGIITQLLVQDGQYVEAGAPLAVVSSSKQLTLRADVPERYYHLLPTITTANASLLHCDHILELSKLNGRRVSDGSPAISERGYLPVYFVFDNNGEAIPGSFVEIDLIGAPKSGVITLPKEALSEQQGVHFTYLKVDDEGYVKVPVEVGKSDGKNVEILSGLTAGQEVVTKGAIAVRLAESSGKTPEGHSHNH